MTKTATNIIAAIKNYSGQSQEALIECLDILPAHGVKKPKNINKLIIDKILFTSGVTNDYGHRRKEDILIRNCAISREESYKILCHLEPSLFWTYP